jgi:hypothetical protein
MLSGSDPPSGFAPNRAMKTPVAPASARDFERRYKALLAKTSLERGNESCVECQRCHGCSACTFCKDSERLVRCHFCVRCSTCTEALHCRGSRGLFNCQHCIDCDSCSQSSYLVRCVSLTACQYCFGCVGLSGKDFHVLNEPYDRKTYFALTERLAKELAL